MMARISDWVGEGGHAIPILNAALVTTRTYVAGTAERVTVAEAERK